jgi:hypothetical protein
MEDMRVPSLPNKIEKKEYERKREEAANLKMIVRELLSGRTFLTMRRFDVNRPI